MQSRILGYSGILFAALAMNLLGCGDVPSTNTENTTGSGGKGGAGGIDVGGMGGSGGVGGTTCTPEDDKNDCTDDVCNANGMTEHNPISAGSNCTTGGNVCDAHGQCVECIDPSVCPGTDDACGKRTCDGGICGIEFTVEGTPIPLQTPGDCKIIVCNGSGGTRPDNDDSDIPDDANGCTADTCNMGVPENTQLPYGSNCAPPGAPDPLVCNAMGQCVGCNVAADCPGTNDECMTRVCNASVCEPIFADYGTIVTTQTPHDCLLQICDGMGHYVGIPRDDDVPLDDGNECTGESCMNGMPMHPDKPVGARCDDGNECTTNDICSMGACLGQSLVVCNSIDACHIAGICDPATGMCTNPAKPDGTACNDNNVCTQPDTCKLGVCVGQNPITCTPADQCHIAGTCDPTSGMCSSPMAPDGSVCVLNGKNGVCSSGTCTLCGNGIIDPGEQCDDGNTKSGDGCSSTCQSELFAPNHEN